MQTSSAHRAVDVVILINVAGIGIAIGGLIDGLRDQSADWVEAWGTWAGVCVTLVSVLVAVRALTADREAEREARRDEDRRSEKAAQVQASHLLISVAPEGRLYGDIHRVSKGRYVIQNLSSRPALDVMLFHPDYCPTPTRVASQIEPGRQAEKTVAFELFQVPNDGGRAAKEKLLASARISFLMDGQRWFRGPVPSRLPTQVIPDGWGTS